MHKKLAFKIVILLVFIILSVVITSTMAIVEYKNNIKITKNNIINHFEIAQEQIIDRFSLKANSSLFYLSYLESMLKNSNDNEFFNNKKKFVEILSNIIASNDSIYSIYMIDNKNNYIGALKVSNEAKKQFHLDENSTFVSIEIDANNTANSHFIIYDQNLKELAHLYKPVNNTNEIKNVFNLGMQNGNKLYKSHANQNLVSSIYLGLKGIFYAKAITKSSIVGMDIPDQHIESNLKDSVRFSNIIVYILDLDENIIASNDNKKYENILRNILKNKENYGIYEDNYEDWIYKITKKNNRKFIFINNLNESLKEHLEQFKTTIYMAIFIILITLPFLYIISSKISKPIKELSQNSKFLKNRQYDKIKNINSNFIEISTLSISFADMANSIKEHENELEEKIKQRTQDLLEKNQELEKLSITDKLTGLNNRIKIDETLEQNKSASNENGVQFGIIIADIDHFKSVNDTYGHNAGDITLKEFSNILIKNSRKTDIVGRCGGEEFMIICKDINLENLTNIAQKLRVKIQEHDFPIIGYKTASFGVAIYKYGEKLQNFINRTDAALYKAKNSGRNRVVNENEI